MEKEEIGYPIQVILRDLAQIHEIPLRYFKGIHFLPEAEKSYFSLLSDLSHHLAFPFGVGIEIEKDKMVAFQGSNKGVAMAYFGKKVRKHSNFTKEQGLLYSHGRRIHLILNENGNGRIDLEDIRAGEARDRLREDSFGGGFDEKPKGGYNFRQSGNGLLPGVKRFLETIID